MNDQEFDDLMRASNPISLPDARALAQPDPALRDGIKNRLAPPADDFRPVLEPATNAAPRRLSRWRPVIAVAAAVAVVAGIAAWVAGGRSESRTPSSPAAVVGTSSLSSPNPSTVTITVSEPALVQIVTQPGDPEIVVVGPPEPTEESLETDTVERTDGNPAAQLHSRLQVPVPSGQLALPPWGDLTSPMLRTDFSDDAAWTRVCKEASAPVFDGTAATEDMPFRASLDCVDDRRYEGLTAADLTQLSPTSPDLSVIFVVDATTLSDPEHPILVVDLLDEPGRTFRVIPHEMWAVQNNVSLGNVFFSEFADSADADGVYRGN